MANRTSNRSERERDRDRNRGENFGGSRREQNFNEYTRGGRSYIGREPQFSNREQQFSGTPGNPRSDYNQSFGASYSPGQSYGGESWGGSWDRNRDTSSEGWRDVRNEFRNMGRHYGGGSQGNFGSDRERNFDRYSTGRDFMTNQPEFSRYGEFEDESRFGRDFGRRSSSDYGREFRYSEPSRSFNRDFTERGGYSGASYGSYGDRDFDSGRTNFDESIAGRSYYGTGSNRGNEREGWRGYGSRPGNMGFGDRERPDDWNRNAYGGGNFAGSENRQYGSRSGRDFFNTDYGSTQYGSWDRDRGNRGESFGDKVKNFFGIGPKGYRRSDERIKEDISERLEDHPAIDASNIEVQVRDGDVTLTGTTDNRYAKRLAEDIADQCRGVRDVHNQICVQSAGTGESGRTGTIQGDLTSRSSETTGKKGSERAA